MFIEETKKRLDYQDAFFIYVMYRHKKGKLPTSHRYDRRTLAAFPPWGVGQELVVWDLPGANI